MTFKKQNFKDKKNPTQQQISKLLEHYQNRRFSDAEKLAVSISKKFPKHPFSWKVLGAVLKQTGRVSESLVVSRKSVQLAPQNAEAHYNMGNTLKQLGRFDEAEESYRQVIALKPGYAEAHGNLGVTLQELGRLDEAKASYRQAIVLKPNYAEVHSLLGVTLQELGRLDEAEMSYTKAIELNPKIPESYQNLVELLTAYAPQKEISNTIVKVDREIKEIDLKDKSSGIISDDKIIQLLCKSSSII